MENEHRKFDVEKLVELKNRHCGYQFCPRCGKQMVEGDIEGRPRMVCLDRECGYIFYQNPVPAAGVIVVENDEILLVKRAHPPRIGWWCIPAGFMEWNEHPRDTAIRELAEETGLDIKLTSIFDVYSGNDDPRTNAILILYLGNVVGGTIRAADDAMEVRYFRFDQIPDNLAFISHHQALDDYKRRFRN